MGWGYGRRGFGWSPVGGILVILGVVLLFSKIGAWWIMFPLFFFIIPMLFSRMGWGRHSHRHRNWGYRDWDGEAQRDPSKRKHGERWNDDKPKNDSKNDGEYVSNSGYYVGDDGEIVRRPTTTDDGMWV